MISIETQVTGPHLANSLANDDEELAYFFMELCDLANERLIGDVAELISDDSVAQFLRALANKIDAENGVVEEGTQ